MRYYSSTDTHGLLTQSASRSTGEDAVFITKGRVTVPLAGYAGRAGETRGRENRRRPNGEDAKLRGQGACVPKPKRHAACLHVSRAMRAA